MTLKPTLLLAEDHEMVGQGLAAMLGSDYDVLEIVPDGADVIHAVRRLKPDVLLLDLSLPNRTGIDLLPELRNLRPRQLVLILTMHTDIHLADLAMSLGARGFVPKNAGLDELRTAIATVLAGDDYVSPSLPEQGGRGAIMDPMGFGQLTPHQQRIVRLLAKGLSSEQIAEELGVTVWTVAFHRKNIRKALGMKSDIEMHRYAIIVGMAEENAKSAGAV